MREGSAATDGVRLEVKHHRVVGDAAAFGQDLGVAGVADAALMEGLLVEGQRRDRVDAARDGQLGGRLRNSNAARPARASTCPGRLG